MTYILYETMDAVSLVCTEKVLALSRDFIMTYSLNQTVHTVPCGNAPRGERVLAHQEALFRMTYRLRQTFAQISMRNAPRGERVSTSGDIIE